MTALAIFGFPLPFALLLGRAAKEHPKTLALGGVFVLVAHALLAFYEVVPPRRPDAFLVLADFAAPLALALGAWFFVLFRYQGRAIVPAGDPRLEKAFHYRSA